MIKSKQKGKTSNRRRSGQAQTTTSKTGQAAADGDSASQLINDFPPLSSQPSASQVISAPTTSKAAVETKDQHVDKDQERQVAIASIKFVSGKQPRRLVNVPSKPVLDNEAARIQEQISSQGDRYVTWNEIVYELVSKYQGCKDIGDLGLAKADDINTIRQLIRYQHFIDSHIQMYSYVKSESCLILSELESQLIASLNGYFFKDRAKLALKCFRDLKMGPLTKNSLIVEIFKFNELTDKELSERLVTLDFMDLVKSIENYLHRSKKWAEKSLDIKEVEEFLLKKYSVTKLNLLGVKITNGKDLVINLKKLRRAQSELMYEMQGTLVSAKRESIQADFEQLINNGVQNYARFDQLIREASKAANIDRMMTLANEFDSYSTKSRYLQMRPLSILEEINEVFLSLVDWDDASQINVTRKVQGFLKELERSAYFGDVFQLAICLGNTNLNVCLNDIIQNKQQLAFKNQIAQRPDKSNKKCKKQAQATDEKVEYTLLEHINYQNLMIRLLYVLVESSNNSYSVEELKAIFNASLMTRNLIVVDQQELASAGSKSEAVEPDKCELSYEQEAKLMSHLNASVDSFLRETVRRNPKSRHALTVDTVLEMDKHIQDQVQHFLEEASHRSSVSFSLLDVLKRSQSLLKKHKLYAISLLTDGSQTVVPFDQAGGQASTLKSPEEYRRQRQSVVEYLRQVKGNLDFDTSGRSRAEDCVIDDSEMRSLEKLENFCCHYFGLRQFEEMGFGSMSSMLGRINRGQETDETTEDDDEGVDQEDDDMPGQSGIIYLDALLNYDECHFVRSGSARKVSPDFVSQLRKETMRKLFECPLLADIGQFVRWRENNCERVLNVDLKQFIADVNRESLRLDSVFDRAYLEARGLSPSDSFSIQVLETEPHGRHLVKLARNASFDALKAAIVQGDSGQASGLLVSLIALNYGSLNKCSRLLLVNEMQSAFRALLDRSAQLESLDKTRSAQMSLNGLVLNDLEKFYLSLNDKNELFIEHTHKRFYSFMGEFVHRLPPRLADQLIRFCLVDSLKSLFEDASLHVFYEHLFVSLVVDSFRRLLVDQSQTTLRDKDLSILFDAKKANSEGNTQATSADRERCVNKLVEMVGLDGKVEFFVELGKRSSVNEWSSGQLRSIMEKLVDIVRCYTSPTPSGDDQQQTAAVQQRNPNHEVESGPTPKRSHNEASTSFISNQAEVDRQPPLALDSLTSDRYSHVSQIRKRYGADVLMSDGERFITDSLKGVLGRSIESLSSELYNKDLHFVLELIQNADDNSYEQDDPTSESADQSTEEPDGQLQQVVKRFKHEPTLVFIFEDDCIVLLNNETGFEAKNLEALCNIKSSTKGKYQRGCIGRKGIGFKSVFTITNRPEIHSNGYHVKFDLDANGKIGYILPTWIDDPAELGQIEAFQQQLVEKLENKFGDLSSSSQSKTPERPVKSIGSLNTCIRLPLKAQRELEHDKSMLLKNSSNAIRPYLLLFLNRLKNLVVIVQDKSAMKATAEEAASLFKIEHFYFRNDLTKSLVELCCESRKFLPNGDSIKLESSGKKWLVLRRSLNIPENVKPSDTNVESTDLCLAFPLEQLQASSSQRGQPLKKMDVFAYLPLRPFGFSFIIQADFVVPASRQDIRQDSVWNQWLCKQIPALFIESFELFKSHQDFGDQIEALKAFLKFVPLEEEIVGFFQHIPRQIFDLLCNREFLPAIDQEAGQESGSSSSSSSVVWKKPFECVILRDKFIREVLTSDLLKLSLGRYYLHPDLIDYIGQENLTNLVHNLGVKTLNIGDILKILNSIFDINKSADAVGGDKSTAPILSYDLNDLKTTAKWLVILQHLLGSCSSSEREKLLSDIKLIPFIPVKVLRDGQRQTREFSNLASKSIFLPIALTTSIESKKLAQNSSKGTCVQDKQSKPRSTAAPSSTDQLVAGFESASKRMEKYLNLLDFEALLCLDESSNSKLVALFETLGVCKVAPRDVIESHVKPRLAEFRAKVSWSTSEEEEAADCVKYVHSVWALGKRHGQNSLSSLLGKYHLSDEALVSDFEDLLWIKTNKGLRRLDSSRSASAAGVNLERVVDERIYLPNEYNPHNQLATLFPSYPWCLVDAGYLSRADSKAGKASTNDDKLRDSWKHFFELFGVSDMFYPATRRFVFTRAELENADSRALARDKEEKPELVQVKLRYAQQLDYLKALRSDEAYLFEDYECPVFNHYASLVEKATSGSGDNSGKTVVSDALRSELNQLFVVIHDNWHSRDHSNVGMLGKSVQLSSFRYVKAKIVKRAAKSESAEASGYNVETTYPFKDPFCESVFLRNLKEKKWIQADHSHFKPVLDHLGRAVSAQLDVSTSFEQPSKVFLRDQTIYKYYGHFTVPFLTEQLNGHLNSKLLTNNDPDYLPIELGFTHRFDSESFIKLLKASVFNKDSFFVASIKQMKLIYSLLNEAIQNDYRNGNNATEMMVKNYPYVFVPQAKLELKQSRSEQYFIGLFYSNQEVCWRDPIQLFDKYSKVKQSLQAEFPANDERVACSFMNGASFQLIQSVYAEEAEEFEEEATTRHGGGGGYYSRSHDNMEHLFVRAFKMRKNPNLEHYVALLEFIVRLVMLKQAEEQKEAESDKPATTSIHSNLFHILSSYNMNEALVDVFAIFSNFGRHFEGLRNERDRQFLRDNLLNAIGYMPILPCFKSQFKSPFQEFERDVPVLADNHELAKLFMNKLSMVVVPSTKASFMSVNISSLLTPNTKKIQEKQEAIKKLIQLRVQQALEAKQEDSSSQHLQQQKQQPAPDQAPEVDEDEQTFAEVCALENLDEHARLFLVDVLGLKMFSKIISLDLDKIETENLRPAPVVQNLLSKAVPFLQYYMYWRQEHKAIYQLLSQDKQLALDKRLKETKFYSVKELNTVYRCTFDSTIKAELTNKTIIDSSVSQSQPSAKKTHWIYYVRHDQLENKKEVIKGFLKVFVPKPSPENGDLFQSLGITSELLRSFEDALMQYSLYSIFPYLDKALKKKDQEIIENDLRIKFSLPESEVKWQVDEVKEPTIEIKAPEKAPDVDKAGLEKLKKSSAELREERALREKEKLKEALRLSHLSQSQINAPSAAKPLSSQTEAVAAPGPVQAHEGSSVVFDDSTHLIYLNAYNEVEKPPAIEELPAEIEGEKENAQPKADSKQFIRRQSEKKLEPVVNESADPLPLKPIRNNEPSQRPRDDYGPSNNCHLEPRVYADSSRPFNRDRAHDLVRYKYRDGEMQVQLCERDTNFAKPDASGKLEPEMIEFSASKWSSKVLDDLNKIVMPLDQLETLSYRTRLERIGRWGELFVNEMLQQRFSQQIEANEIKVVWLNEQDETGLPYDFIVIDLARLHRLREEEEAAASCQKRAKEPVEHEIKPEDVKYFIEVKTTTKMDREYFYISYNELMFAKSQADKFMVYRLYNGYNDPSQVKLKEIGDIPAHLHSHQIKLFMYI